MGKSVKPKSGLFVTHYCQRTQILVMFGSHLPHFKQGEQQKVKKPKQSFSLTVDKRFSLLTDFWKVKIVTKEITIILSWSKLLTSGKFDLTYLTYGLYMQAGDL